MLSGLVLTDDESLATFRDRRAADPTLDVEHLRRARDILDVLQSAITQSGSETWERVQRAWEILHAGAAEDAAAARPETAVEEAKPSSRPSAGGFAGPSLSDAPPPPAPVGASARPSSPGLVDTPPPLLAAVLSPSSSPPAPPPLAAVPSPSSSPPSPVPAPVGLAGAGSPWTASRDSTDEMPRESDSRPSPRGDLPPALLQRLQAFDSIKLDPDGPHSTLPALARGAPGALPFRDAVPEPPQPVGADPSHAVDLGGTAMGMTSPFANRRATLPFTAIPDLRVAEADTPRSADAVPFRASQPHSPSPTPPAALPAHLSSLTLEQYSSLCAECAVNPEWSESIQGRYGVKSEQERAALDTYWRGQMNEQPPLRASFEQNLARFRQWLASKQST